MKKFVLIIMVLIFPMIARADQGDCSSHRGVNCNAGPDRDNSVICNDGWTDSSDYFSTVVECRDNDYCWFTRGYLLSDYNVLSNKYNLTSRNEEIKNKKEEYYQYQISINNQKVQDAKDVYALEGQVILMEQIRGQQTALKIERDRNIYIMEIELSNKLAKLNILIDSYNADLKNYTQECNMFGYNGLIKYNFDQYSKIVVEKNCEVGFIKRDGKCITYTQNCQNKYGYYSYGNEDYCYCNVGYEFNSDKTNCIQKQLSQNIYSNYQEIENKKKEYLKTEKELVIKVDKNLTKKLKGKILLQVEDKGQAWYVNPKDEKKYYMANGDEAFKIMRNLGVGVTNKDLEKIKSDKKYAQKNSGKIFLQIEAHGEAYYIDFNGSAHYLRDGGVAYATMRDLGLGVTNNDLRKIGIGE